MVALKEGLVGSCLRFLIFPVLNSCCGGATSGIPFGSHLLARFMPRNWRGERQPVALAIARVARQLQDTGASLRAEGRGLNGYDGCSRRTGAPPAAETHGARVKLESGGLKWRPPDGTLDHGSWLARIVLAIYGFAPADAAADGAPTSRARIKWRADSCLLCSGIRNSGHGWHARRPRPKAHTVPSEK